MRQFNDTIRAVYGRTPTELRRRASPAHHVSGSRALTVRLSYRDPLDWDHLLGFLAARAVPGVEEIQGAVYRRTLRLPHGHGVVELSLDGRYIECGLELADLRDLPAAVQRCRRLLDLDADPSIPGAHLARDPLLSPLVAETPGLRVPGAVDGSELAIRAVLGQQVSVAAARTTAGKLTVALGETLPAADGGLAHLFPSAHAIASADPAVLPGPVRRGQTLHALATALAREEIAIDPGSDRSEIRSQLMAIPGIGAWTSDYIAMSALSDPDAFLPTDLGVKRALAQLGRSTAPKDITDIAEQWRPWRAYALQHLCATYPLGRKL